jgi:hypothetical protein
VLYQLSYLAAAAVDGSGRSQFTPMSFSAHWSPPTCAPKPRRQRRGRRDLS